MSGGVTGAAGFGIGVGTLMGIVAGEAGELSLRFEVAGGLEETVGRGDHFEFVAEGRLVCVIEVEHVVGEGLFGAVGEDSAAGLAGE